MGVHPGEAVRPPARVPSRRALEIAALFYSLLESAKLAGIDPAAYLPKARRRAIDNLGTATLTHDLSVA